MMSTLAVDDWDEDDESNIIDETFGGLSSSNDPCDINNLEINNNTDTIAPTNIDSDDDYDPGF